MVEISVVIMRVLAPSIVARDGLVQVFKDEDARDQTSATSDDLVPLETASRWARRREEAGKPARDARNSGVRAVQDSYYPALADAGTMIIW